MIISMKINWGHKLVFFAASFMLFVMFMVYRISTQKIDLVDQNYYENGVAYQASINKFRAAQALSPQINFQLQNLIIYPLTQEQSPNEFGVYIKFLLASSQVIPILKIEIYIL